MLLGYKGVGVLSLNLADNRLFQMRRRINNSSSN